MKFYETSFFCTKRSDETGDEVPADIYCHIEHSPGSYCPVYLSISPSRSYRTAPGVAFHMESIRQLKEFQKSLNEAVERIEKANEPKTIVFNGGQPE